MRLRWTPRARSVIDAIHDYISKHNPRAATALIDRIRQSAALLANYPRMGRETDIASVQVLPVVRYPYLLYHRVDDDELVIVHVRYGARDAPQPGAL